MDKCIGLRIYIVMKSDKEIVGTFLGFDDFVSIFLKGGGDMGFFLVFKNRRIIDSRYLLIIIVRINLFLG